MQIGEANLGAFCSCAFHGREIDTFMNASVGSSAWILYIPTGLDYELAAQHYRSGRTQRVVHFRNIIAHGQEIPEKPYRQKSDLISTNGERINDHDYYRAELMLESSLFMLTTALRRYFGRLFDQVKDQPSGART